MKKNVILICLFIWVLAPSTAQDTDIAYHQDPLGLLVEYMSGYFSSEAQSLEEEAFFHITLCMQEFSFGREGHWLYVEQAAASTPGQPYRQRIYHVYQGENGLLISKVYELENPENYIGACLNTALLSGLNQSQLIDREGCAIQLQLEEDGTFVGSTAGKTCLSTLRGARYATSEVEIHPDYLLSWDRGWNEADEQVWGADKGAYRFDKLPK